MSLPRTAALVVLLASLVAILGCNPNPGTGNGDADPGAASEDQVILPKPAPTGGSVTGMPAKPGPNPVGEALIAQGAAVTDAVPPGNASAALANVSGDITMEGSSAGVAPSDSSIPVTGAEPSVQDALAVIADYYAAIQHHDYAHAWALWSDGGRSSGQTLQQFADGFANTDAVSVQLGAPGRIDAAAGSRYLQVPVTITATLHDGATRRYIGSYTLRRAVVDGASADQRAWHIGSASLRAVEP
ncbi:hypothetical protein [Cognatiluteimonas telluris]|jgi:hypothetical protein|uniref:hypothetical protein n=1 Tax=Cognatiluteimonas telluris TaxID=1104775 RepID=UPI0014093055|nr:hypothetical protein [Lysobacter telluris]